LVGALAARAAGTALKLNKPISPKPPTEKIIFVRVFILLSPEFFNVNRIAYRDLPRSIGGCCYGVKGNSLLSRRLAFVMRRTSPIIASREYIR
jgi:hypothetical protein